MPSKKKNVSTSQREIGPRKRPVQQRSQERFDRILNVAAGLIKANGSDSLTMSAVVEEAGISFGSLYQYFPDKSSIILTLAERYNEHGRQCVEEILDSVSDEKALRTAVCDVVDGFYALYLDEPVMRDIWAATQADKLLQELDAADVEEHAKLLFDKMTALRPRADKKALATLAQFLNYQLSTAVRLAISLPRREGDAVIEMFKRGLPEDMFSYLPQARRRMAKSRTSHGGRKSSKAR